MIRPIVLYASETWTTTKASEQIVAIFEWKFYERYLAQKEII